MTNLTAHLDPLKLEATPEALAADAELVQLYQQFVEQKEAADSYKRQWDEYRAKFEANHVPPEPPLPKKLKSIYEPDRPGGMTVAECEASHRVHMRHKGKEWADNWRREVAEASTAHSAAMKEHREAFWEAWDEFFPEGLRQRVDDARDAAQNTEQQILTTSARTALGMLIKLRVWEASTSGDDRHDDHHDEESMVCSVMADAARIASMNVQPVVMAAE